MFVLKHRLCGEGGEKSSFLNDHTDYYIMLTGSFLEYCTRHNMSNRAKGLVTRARATLAGIEG